MLLAPSPRQVGEHRKVLAGLLRFALTQPYARLVHGVTFRVTRSGVASTPIDVINGYHFHSFSLTSVSLGVN